MLHRISMNKHNLIHRYPEVVLCGRSSEMQNPARDFHA